LPGVLFLFGSTGMLAPVTASAAEAVLEVTGLVKRYGERTAVSSVDLTVRRGEIFGLLGPNGAGKTTTISIACGVVPATSGTVKVAGHDIARDPAHAKRAIGLVPQDLALYEDLSARQNLQFFGALYGLAGRELDQRIAQALEISQLTDRADEQAKQFSGGMKRRLNMVAGLLHEPTLLVLDEPTVGVDPQSRRHIFDAIRALRDRGMTVIYTSHYMEEVEELCDRIAIIDAGKLVAQGTLAELARDHGGDSDGLEMEIAGDAATFDAAVLAAEGLGGKRAGGVLQFSARDTWGPFVAAIEATGARIKRMGGRRADLETVFLALTGRGLRDA
jgi:ABC-2 type transport system ATP-binding protein